jgi:hypothetical protein
MTSHSDLIKECDRLLSLFVRQVDADEEGMVRCCTCPIILHWRHMQCGHFISRSHMGLRWVLQNTGPQCRNCNEFSSNKGEPEKFAEYLDRTHGPGTSQQMKDMRHTEYHHTPDEIMEYIETIKIMLKSHHLKTQ